MIDKDIRILSEYGVKYIRAFPNWRDFQPVMPLLGSVGGVSSYCLEDEKTIENSYFLDEEMLERFSAFLDVCGKYSVKVIVGLITGWMSGGLFVPPSLYGKNVITDPFAQYLEQLFIRGFIVRFKNRSEILAWDLGNERNCLAPVDTRREPARKWAIVCARLGVAKQKCKINPETEDTLNQLLYGVLYLAYDTSSDFISQFEKNAAAAEIIFEKIAGKSVEKLLKGVKLYSFSDMKYMEKQ